MSTRRLPFENNVPYSVRVPTGVPVERVLANVVVVVMVASFPVVLTGAMSVEMESDIGFDAPALGAAVTAYYIVSAILSTACGRLTEALGSRRTTRAAALFGSAGCFIIAAASGMPVLVAGMLVGGVAIAIAQPASNAAILHGVPTERRGLAFGIKQSAIPAGTALAGFAVPAVALTIGWRWAFAGAGVLSALAAGTVPPGSPPATSSRADRRGLLRGSYGTLVLLAVAAALGAAPAMCLPVFLAGSATDRGLSSGVAGMLLAAGSIGGLVVRMITGAAADRRVGGHLRTIAALMAMGTVGLAAMAIDHRFVFVGSTILAFGTGWAWQGLFNHAVTNRWTQAPAAATGITQTGVFIGGVIGPPAFGAASAHWSDGVGWLVLSGMMASATVIVLLIRRSSRRAAVPPLVTEPAP